MSTGTLLWDLATWINDLHFIFTDNYRLCISRLLLAISKYLLRLEIILTVLQISETETTIKNSSLSNTETVSCKSSHLSSQLCMMKKVVRWYRLHVQIVPIARARNAWFPLLTLILFEPSENSGKIKQNKKYIYYKYIAYMMSLTVLISCIYS